MSGILFALFLVLSVVGAFLGAFRAREAGFRRSSDNVLGGICAGIAQAFKVEAWLIRLIAGILLFTPIGGFVLAAYVVFWGVVPQS